MENIGYRPVPINSDMSKIEASVKKQTDLILKKKGMLDEKLETEAKDVIDKAALYKNEELISETMQSGLLGQDSDTTKIDQTMEDNYVSKRPNKRGNKVGVVSRAKSEDDFHLDKKNGPKKVKKVSPFKLPKI